MIDRWGGVRLSEKARGAAARPALCKSARRGIVSGSLKKRAVRWGGGGGVADRSLEGGGGLQTFGGGEDSQTWGWGGVTDHWGGEGGGGQKCAARRRVRLSEKSRGAEARLAL